MEVKPEPEKYLKILLLEKVAHWAALVATMKKKKCWDEWVGKSL